MEADKRNGLPNGVMLNAYPDSIGSNLADIVEVLKKPEFKDTFSLFYILPTFFNSDLDRGFSVIDYDINTQLVSPNDIEELDRLGIMLKFDLVLNHLSVGSPQFKDMLGRGDGSEYKDFFIDWNEFWKGEGLMGGEGHVVPKQEHLSKLFMRKPGLPILKVRFPDGTDRPYWNTFYQQIDYREIRPEDLVGIDGIGIDGAKEICDVVNRALRDKRPFSELRLGPWDALLDRVLAVVEKKRSYLGQMDINARSQKVWDFYDETLKKLKGYGAKLIRLDAFAYLHKEPGETNFFNKPGTWEYLDRLKKMAQKHELLLLPEIHSEYGTLLHREVSGEDFPIYDFFFPGLVIDALDRGRNAYLLKWIAEIQSRGMRLINMLGCHDGIPVLDLKGKEVDGVYREGLMPQGELDAIVDNILSRGGRVKNLYGPDGKKISYYQVNATFFSALGEDEKKLLLARAIQLFMPGIPQVWYLDIFAGKNDYAAADNAGTAGHKEINRTTLTRADIDEGLKRDVVRDQLELIRLRNTSDAFGGTLSVGRGAGHLLELVWKNGAYSAALRADLKSFGFRAVFTDADGTERSMER